MIDAQSLPVLNALVDKLVNKLLEQQEQLRVLESRTGKGWNPRTTNKLRDEIAKTEEKLKRAETLQDAALATRDRYAN